MPDSQEQGGYQPTHYGHRETYVYFAAFFLIVAMIVASFYYGGQSTDVRHRFMANCIEFQSIERCKTLFYYDRGDLVRPR